MNLRQNKNGVMSTYGVTRSPYVVQNATVEEQETSPSTSRQNDVRRRKPVSGGLRPDASKKENGGIKLRKSTFIGTWNVRSMSSGKLEMWKKK